MQTAVILQTAGSILTIFGTVFMKTGWILYKDAWYYCGESGAMLVNATTLDGYYVNGDGVWVQ